MSVLIIGSEGSMGKRYQAILRHLGKEFECIDVGSPTPAFSRFDGFIVATPTETHAPYIHALAKFGKPILVEKPISTDLNEVRFCIDLVRERKVPMSMMLQYSMLLDQDSEGPTHYNYFRHGNDGIHWDCLQIIGLAKDDDITLEEDSPIWQCTINGQSLDSRDMDHAYVAFMNNWFHLPNQDLGRIHHMHEKADYLARKATK